MRPDSRKYLYDIQTACRKLQGFTRNRSLEDYLADEMLHSAIERQFEIIGEALSQLYRNDSNLAGSIPDARRIIAFRNILIHGYATIRHVTFWGLVQTDLPILSRNIAELLQP
jgi:uncharacterized protein with HEPN domain